MNIPGFNAEVSLYRTNQRYQLLASWAGVTREYVGLAQFLARAPGGESCLPKLTGCVPDEESSTGCSRYFITRDCEVNRIGPCRCPGPVQCGPCVGVRQCSDGSQRPCSRP